MNKVDLVNKVKSETGETKACVEEVINAFLLEVMKGLKDDGEVRFYPLGRLKVKKYKSRIGSNPNTGEKMKIEAKNKVKFFASTELKESINESK